MRSLAGERFSHGDWGDRSPQTGGGNATSGSLLSRASTFADRAATAGFVASMIFLAVAAIYAFSLSDSAKPFLAQTIALVDEAALDAGFKFKSEEFALSGTQNTPDADLLKALKLPYKGSSLFYDAGNARRALLTIGWIESAEVRRILPSRLEVAIVERKPFARWEDARHKVQIIDREGHILGPDEVGRFAGAVFASILLNASIIGAASVTLSTSYAFGDVFGAHHSLHRGWRDAKFFYGAFTAMVVLAAGIVLIPGAPLGLITTGVQALAGVLLPSATVFLLLLCNDKQVLGPWVNRLWLNILASVIVSILLAMSLVLMITTLFSSVNVTILAEVLGGVLLVCYLVAAVVLVRNRSRREPVPVVPMERKATWRMPQLSLLERPTWSRTRLIGMWGLRVYLVVAVLLLLVKAVELGFHHGG